MYFIRTLEANDFGTDPEKIVSGEGIFTAGVALDKARPGMGVVEGFCWLLDIFSMPKRKSCSSSVIHSTEEGVQN